MLRKEGISPDCEGKRDQRAPPNEKPNSLENIYLYDASGWNFSAKEIEKRQGDNDRTY